MKIGFFDSGLGGLVVMNAVRNLLPHYDYVYFGDTANLPYGDKSEEEIFALTKSGVEFLYESDCTLVIIACNTASAETLRQLQDHWLPYTYPDRKLLGVIVPMAEEVVECKAKCPALIATKRTITSGKYEKVFSDFPQAPEVFAISTPQLVPLIEAGKLEEAVSIVEGIIEEGLTAGMDSIILGCTHYALLLPYLNERYGNTLMIFSPDQVIPKKVYKYLEKHTSLASCLTTDGTLTLHLSADRPEYQKFLQKLNNIQN